MRRDELAAAASTGVEPGEGEALRARFFFVVARTRLDLFLAMRRHFQHDRTVHVLLDRREGERRCRPGAGVMPNRRRQPDRRRRRDYWEDIAHHPAVRVRRSPGSAMPDGDNSPNARPLEHEEGSAWSDGPVDVARLRAWIAESERIVPQLLPRVFGEVTVLESLLHGATGRCRDLEEENAALHAEAARAVATEREMAQGYAEMIGSVREFLWQLTAALEHIQTVARNVGNADRSPGRGG